MSLQICSITKVGSQVFSSLEQSFYKTMSYKVVR